MSGPAHHHADELRFGDPRRGARAHAPPVLEHGDTVGDGEDLVEAVGDVDSRAAGLAEGAQDGEELLELGVGEHGRGLVEDDHARHAPQGLGDLDHLALRDAEAADALTRVDALEAQLGQARGRGPMSGPPVDDPGRTRGHLAEEQVLGHGQMRRRG